MRGRRLGIAVMAMLVVPAAYAVGCVDGTTPDCSNPAVKCGPILDGSLDSREAQTLPESAPPDADAAQDTAVPDADDPDADAGDQD